jgi:hypothetical protein
LSKYAERTNPKRDKERGRLQRCKDIWVEGADRYRNPDKDLQQDFSENRQLYYQDLSHSQDAAGFVKDLKANMFAALNRLNKSMPKNQKVKLKNTDKNRICITPLDEQPEPQNINRLKGEIQLAGIQNL